MKKIYLQPEIEMMDGIFQELLADSFILNSDGDVVGGELIDENAEGDGLSRRQTTWNDFDDE